MKGYLRLEPRDVDTLDYLQCLSESERRRLIAEYEKHPHDYPTLEVLKSLLPIHKGEKSCAPFTSESSSVRLLLRRQSQ